MAQTRVADWFDQDEVKIEEKVSYIVRNWRKFKTFMARLFNNA